MIVYPLGGTMRKSNGHMGSHKAFQEYGSDAPECDSRPEIEETYGLPLPPPKWGLELALGAFLIPIALIEHGIIMTLSVCNDWRALWKR